MIPLRDRTRRWLQTIALAGMAASLPLLYLGAVTMESDPLTVSGLVVAGVVAVISWLAF